MERQAGDPYQGALAAAVGPQHDPVLVRGDAPVDAVQHLDPVDRHADGLQDQHGLVIGLARAHHSASTSNSNADAAQTRSTAARVRPRSSTWASGRPLKTPSSTAGTSTRP